MIKIARAAMVAICMCLNISILGTIFLICTLFKYIMPGSLIRRFFFFCTEQLYHLWVDVNSIIYATFLPTKWNYEFDKELSPTAWYAIIANHSSGVDILALQKVFNRKIPHLKFFMKDSLKWVPFVGIICYLSDYPLIKRYNASQIRKNPKNKLKNVNSLKSACKRLKKNPVTIINFLEGARFNETRKKLKKSPYKNLLPPQAAGTSIVLNELKDEITQVLDVTINYSKGATLVDFITGNIPEITVKLETIDLNSSWHGEFYEDKVFRQTIVAKFQNLWQQKDKLINQMFEQT